MKRNNKGFTLAELLIVVAVIAVLVAVAIPTFGSQLEKSRQAVDLSNLRGAYAAAKMLILNQDDNDSFLNTVKKDTTKTGDAKDVYAWYDPDSGNFAFVTKGATITDAQKVGKATTASVIVATDGLPETIFYADGVLKKGTAGKDFAGTKDTGIVVKFIYDAFTNTYSVPTVTFNDKAQVGSLTAITDPTVASGSGGSLASKSVALSPTPTDLHGDDLATGTTAAFTYAAASGLPSGVTLAADGSLSGTITKDESFSVIITETNTKATAVYTVKLTYTA